MTRDHVVAFHYAALDPDGAVLEQTFGEQPLSYLHGANNIAPELEEALAGRAPGEPFELSFMADEDDAPRELADVQVLPRRLLPAGLSVAPGLPLVLETRDAKAVMWVYEASARQVRLSSTPPHQARPMRFRLEVVSVRPASAEEIERGHAS